MTLENNLLYDKKLVSDEIKKQINQLTNLLDVIDGKKESHNSIKNYKKLNCGYKSTIDFFECKRSLNKILIPYSIVDDKECIITCY